MRLQENDCVFPQNKKNIMGKYGHCLKFLTPDVGARKKAEVRRNLIFYKTIRYQGSTSCSIVIEMIVCTSVVVLNNGWLRRRIKGQNVAGSRSTSHASITFFKIYNKKQIRKRREKLFQFS